jgi:hypothetical protein
VQVQMNPSVLQVMLALLDKLQAAAQWGVGFDVELANDANGSHENVPPLMH